MAPPIRRADANVFNKTPFSVSREVSSQRATKSNGGTSSAVRENRVNITTKHANEEIETTRHYKKYDLKKTGGRDVYEYKEKRQGEPVKQKDRNDLLKRESVDVTLFEWKPPGGKPLIEKKGSPLASGKATLPGKIDVEGTIQGRHLAVDGEASAKVNGRGKADVVVKLDIDANLLKMEGAAERVFHIPVNGEDVSVRVKLDGKAPVGADGSLKLTLHVDPKNPKQPFSIAVGAEGFVGAKGTLSGTISASVNDREVLSGKLSATAAAGLAGGAEFEWGLTHFKAKADAAVGLGLGVEVSGDVNVYNLAKEALGLLTPGASARALELQKARKTAH